MSPAERDAAEEEYEGRKADVAAREYLTGGATDFERDSEPPPR